jgi:hypothetical protein
MQTYVEVEVKLHTFLIWELAGPTALLGGKNPRYALDCKLGGPQNRSRLLWRGKNLLSLLGNQTQFCDRSAHGPATTHNELSQF